MIGQDVDEVGTEPPSNADSDLFGLDWGGDAITTINSVTERNDRTRGGKELLAFVDSGEVNNVLPKSVCAEYPLEATSKSQSGVGFKSANGSHQALRATALSSQDKCRKQYEHYVGGRRWCINCGLPPAVYLRGVTSLCWMRNQGSSARMETQVRFRGLVVCSPYGCGFRRFFTSVAEHEPHQEKKV